MIIVRVFDKNKIEIHTGEKVLIENPDSVLYNPIICKYEGCGNSGYNFKANDPKCPQNHVLGVHYDENNDPYVRCEVTKEDPTRRLCPSTCKFAGLGKNEFFKAKKLWQN